MKQPVAQSVIKTVIEETVTTGTPYIKTTIAALSRVIPPLSLAPSAGVVASWYETLAQQSLAVAKRLREVDV